MENASKALIIAGSVLMALLVISLLVFFYNNLQQWQKVDLSAEEQAQIVEYNKQYEVYARDLYGTDIFSLCNKIVDYKKRETDPEQKKYQEITIELKISNTLLPTLNLTVDGQQYRIYANLLYRYYIII